MASDRLVLPLIPIFVSILLTIVVFASPCQGQETQTAPAGGIRVEARIDSGFILEHRLNGVVFQSHVHEPGASWIRLRFDEVLLAGDPDDETRSVLRLTSLLDGAVQELDALDLVRWSNSSAYFNGDTVLIEVVSRGANGIHSIRMSEFTAGPDAGVTAEVQRTLCGVTDDRELSYDPRIARVAPIGCTAWMIDDCNNCFLSAGHCIGTGSQIVQFNVPLSNPNGSWNHPHPDDQYPIDQDSMQFEANGTGSDWAYFGAFPNSSTGLRPADAQGEVFEYIAPPTVAGQTIRITGYGTVLWPMPGTWNAVQKTHTGPFTQRSGSRVWYAADTTGGNSGGPVILESSGKAIGIHTHGGCTTLGGANTGTSIIQSALQNALANPLGVCCENSPEAPGGFALITPANGAEAIELDPLLRWQAAENSSYYRIWLADNPDFDSPVISGVTTANTQLALPQGLLEKQTTYYWYVAAYSSTHLERLSTPEVAQFTTEGVPVDCPGDVDGNLLVDLSDLNTILTNFGQPTEEGATLGDLDQNGIVDLHDLNLVLTNFGNQCL